MPTALKRKGSPSLEEAEEASKRRFAETEDTPATDHANDDDDATTPSAPVDPNTTNPPSTSPNEPPPASDPSSHPAPTDRASRFAALRARNQAGRKSNLSATKSEAARRATPTDALTALGRKRDVAEHKLLKAETAANGEDFERKRAWDWTADESARWDARLAEKRERAARNSFRDYAQEAEKVYDRQIGGLVGRDAARWEERRGEYEVQKRQAIERAVASGGLEVVELEGGEMIAVDRDGSFVSSSAAPGSSGGGAGQKPSKEAVDRLVEDIRKAEETRLRKRRERGKGDEDGGDVTYINEKNKQFNLKLARFYDKYTADIRESFERGTAI